MIRSISVSAVAAFARNNAPSRGSFSPRRSSAALSRGAIAYGRMRATGFMDVGSGEIITEGSSGSSEFLGVPRGARPRGTEEPEELRGTPKELVHRGDTSCGNLTVPQ